MAKREAAMAKREGRQLKERKQQWLSKMEKAEGTKKGSRSCLFQLLFTISDYNCKSAFSSS